METLSKLLLEARYDKSAAEEWVRSGKQMSIQYKNPEGGKASWYRISPVKVDSKGGKDYLIAWDKGSGSEDQLSFDLSGIVNVNRASSASSSWSEQDIQDSIKNKRVVEITYQGVLEKSKGHRYRVMPVCLGTIKGRKYIRAWQEAGATVRGVPKWKLFRIDRISDWKNQGTLNFECSDLGPNLNQAGDKGMDRVLVIIDCEAGKAPTVKPTGATGSKPSVKKKAAPKKKAPASKKVPKEPSSTSAPSELPKGPEGGAKRPAPRPGAKNPERSSKGAARPGAKGPERTGKGPARPGALNEGDIIDTILEAVRIL